MGKTVKSRTIVSIASFVLVLALCIVANSSVPGLYKSYKERVIAQQAAAQSTQTVQKAQNTPAPQEQPEVPVDEEPVVEEPVIEDSNVYDIPEEPVVEEAPAEPAEEPEEDVEDFDFDIDTDDENKDDKDSKGGFFDIIINLVKSIIEKITSLDILGKIKSFFAALLKLFGIEL